MRSRGGNKKPVLVTDDHGNTTEYPSQTAAAVAIGATQSQISLMCLGYSGSWRGFTVKFKREEPTSYPTVEGVEPCP